MARVLFYKHGLTSIPAWLINHMLSKMWDEMTYPFPNFNGGRFHRWSLGMDKSFHPTHYNGCNYLSMLGLKLIHVSKRGYSISHGICTQFCYGDIIALNDSILYVTYLLIFFRVASLALGQSYGQSYDCPNTSEVTLKDMCKIYQWLTTTKHESNPYFLGYTSHLFWTNQQVWSRTYWKTW